MFVRPSAPIKLEYAELIERKFDIWSLNEALLDYLILVNVGPVQRQL
jgi:hypothetical protein